MLKLAKLVKITLANFSEGASFVNSPITWPPDFVETATIAEEAFLREAEGLNIGIKTAQDIDGVIAVTPTFISDLLELSGNLEIREYFIGSNNLADVLEYESHIGHAKAGLPTDKRKELILKSLVQMFNNIFDLENDNWPELVNILFDNLNKKHVVVYSKNQEVQNELEEMNWAGEIRDYAGDYLLVTDANLASLKTNRFVDRTVYYEIIPNGNFGYKAKVDIIYKHYGEPSYKVTEKYGAYVKIYVPLGAKFVKVTGNQDKLDRGQELGKQWFGTYFSLNTGEEKTLTFEYQLPEFITKQIESGEYKLFVQKQIGSVNDYLRLNLGFHEQIVGAKPEELKELQGDNLYEQEMKFDSDMEFLLQIVN